MALRNRRLAELALFASLAALHTWPLVTDPAHLSRFDNDDTWFNMWVIAWVEHQVPRDPLRLFEAPIFFPEHDTLAYSEHMIVPAMMGAPLQWAGASPVLVFNLLVVAGYTLSGFAMMRLVARWTGSAPAGIVSGALFAFNAHLLTRFAHLQALHVEFLPVVLYALDRFLDERRPRHALLLGVAYVLQSLCSNYTMVMLGLAIVVATLVRAEPWGRAAPRIWPGLALAGVGAVICLTPFLLPYYRLNQTQGLVRGIEEVRLFSAGWSDYLATAGTIHFRLWSHWFFEGRTALFPGMIAIGLTALALLTRTAWRDRRARMALAFGIAGGLLSLGAYLPGYEWLQQHVTLLQGIRAAARWGFLLLTAVAILAGFGVAALQERWGRHAWWPALTVALVGLVTLEALRAPLTLSRFPGIAPIHSRLRTDDVTGLVVFPLYGGGEFHHNAPYLLDQTRHWRPMINGYSSFAPQSFFDRVARLRAFPDAPAIAELRAIGVSHVLLQHASLDRDDGRNAGAALRAHPDLTFVLDQDGWAVFELRTKN